MICLLLCCFSASTSFSQIKNFIFPSIPQSGKSINDFIPIRWKLKDTVSGDFNLDKQKNLVMVIECKDSLSFEDTTCFSNEPFYPRMLIIVNKQKGEDYKISVVATKMFGICNWGIQGTDPYVGLSKRGNTFVVEFSDGGTLRNVWTYYFMFQNGDWFLIGASELTYWTGHPGAYFEDLNLTSGEKHVIDKNNPRGKDISYAKFSFKPEPLVKLTELNPDTALPFTPDHN
jgi:hypothetical protein